MEPKTIIFDEKSMKIHPRGSPGGPGVAKRDTSRWGPPGQLLEAAGARQGAKRIPRDPPGSREAIKKLTGLEKILGGRKTKL